MSPIQFGLPTRLFAAVTLLGIGLCAAESVSAEDYDARTVAARVDQFILDELKLSGVTPSPLTTDEDFLRRVTFDLTGAAPSPRDVTLFGLNPSRDKRFEVIDRLLASDEYAENWTRYWRDVIFNRATNMRARFVESAFDEWMQSQLAQNRPWDEIATDLITAEGDVRENGETAILFAHEGDASEIASEVSRIFLGIQIQCANCHDHPTDQWRREQFHQLAAFFPRIRVRPIREEQRLISYEVASVNGNPRRGQFGQTPQFSTDVDRLFRFADRNRDDGLSREELARSPQGRFYQRLFDRADGNDDDLLSRAEVKAVAERVAQNVNRFGGPSEHFMPDLDNPSSRGTPIDPVFFVSEESLPSGQPDQMRREKLAEFLTDKDNPWFARALVNRLWTEMLGVGFYTPVDDIGPEREVAFPQVLHLLCDGFIAHDYDVKWLFRAITNTEAYQRQIRASRPADTSIPFASASPTRLRSDQLYTAILAVAGIEESTTPQGRGYGGGFRGRRSPRDSFNAVFGFDPSTPQADVIGTIPQALFMMNSPQIQSLTRADSRSPLGQILQDYTDDDEALSELFLRVLAREPTERELSICKEYIAEVGNRSEAFEDLMWSLLNSSEFLSKR